ncbi:MAG TPA: SMP-30/gluconolactonase/LRE family protein [Vicinamibacteria bacterium]|nr:SMP-30/gluconolactonase/LRE family protein [Vicinamibacteria bacterium]
MSAADVEVVLDARAELGEGPRWDPGEQRLLWVDIMAGRVHAFRPDKGACRNVGVGKPVGALAGARDGSLVLAVADGFARLDFKSGATTMLAAVEADRPQNRMNDGACDPAGRFWAGTMALDESPGQGALYRLDPDLTVHTMVTSVTISNGIDWSLDGRRMYYVDSPTRRIDVFDLDGQSGGITNRRPFATIPAEAGIPDGLTVDADGFVWLALWGGAALRRYAPDGTLERTVPLPVSHPTSCAFGGAALDELYVTSARRPLSVEERKREPEAGSLLRLRPGVKGRPANLFGGRA